MNKVRIALVGLLGLVATAGLLTTTPAEESGRTVQATILPGGTIEVQHVTGPEYLRAYADVVGVWTICDGLTRGVKRGMVETRAGCMERLEAELLEHAQRVVACVPDLARPGRDYQRWAFVSLSYNIGWPSACSSTAARLANAGKWDAACSAFDMWVKGTKNGRKVVLPGLVKRRLREEQICKTGQPGFPAATLKARLEKVR
jgi:lysozyme